MEIKTYTIDEWLDYELYKEGSIDKDIRQAKADIAKYERWIVEAEEDAKRHNRGTFLYHRYRGSAEEYTENITTCKMLIDNIEDQIC
jgi:hypothetical protein